MENLLKSIQILQLKRAYIQKLSLCFDSTIPNTILVHNRNILENGLFLIFLNQPLNLKFLSYRLMSQDIESRKFFLKLYFQMKCQLAVKEWELFKIWEWHCIALSIDGKNLFCLFIWSAYFSCFLPSTIFWLFGMVKIYFATVILPTWSKNYLFFTCP